MTTSSTLSVKESLSFGWKTFKARPWFFIGTLVAYMALQFILGTLQENMPGILSFVLSIIVSTFAYLGLISIYLSAHDNPQTPQWKDAWNPKPFWKYLGASILLGIIVVIGLVLLVVPGIYLAIVLSFTGFLVVDRGLGPIEALKESARLTKGNRWKLFLLGLAILGLSILGAIPLLLGLLVVAPVSLLAGIHAYRTLSRSESEVVPTAPAS